MPNVSDHDRALIHSLLERHGIREMDEQTAILELAQIVSAIPWGEGRAIADVLGEKGAGTCTGKHLVLNACFDELGIESRLVVSTFHWHEQEIKYPKELQEFLEDHHWQHAHMFIQVRNSDGAWVDADVTWDPPLQKFGFWPLPADWDGEHSFVGLKILERWDGIDITAKQDELINLLSPEQQRAREHFRKIFIEWVKTLRDDHQH